MAYVRFSAKTSRFAKTLPWFLVADFRSELFVIKESTTCQPTATTARGPRQRHSNRKGPTRMRFGR